MCPSMRTPDEYVRGETESCMVPRVLGPLHVYMQMPH